MFFLKTSEETIKNSETYGILNKLFVVMILFRDYELSANTIQKIYIVNQKHRNKVLTIRKKQFKRLEIKRIYLVIIFYFYAHTINQVIGLTFNIDGRRFQLQDLKIHINKYFKLYLAT